MTGKEFIDYCKVNKIVSITDKYHDKKEPAYLIAYFSFEITFENGSIVHVSTSTDWDQGILEYKLEK